MTSKPFKLASMGTSAVIQLRLWCVRCGAVLITDVDTKDLCRCCSAEAAAPIASHQDQLSPAERAALRTLLDRRDAGVRDFLDECGV